MCQRRDIALHCTRQSHQRRERQVVLAALDPADIAAIEAGDVGQPLLRQPKLAPAFADALAEDVEIRIAHICSERSW